MGYLQLPSLPAHNKGVISLWFRIPAATFTAAAAQAADSTIPFAKYIPLLCWGEPKNFIEYDQGTVDIMDWQNPTDPAGDIYEPTKTNPHSTDDLGPSYIAVVTRLGVPVVEVKIQTNTAPTIVGHTYVADSITAWSNGLGPSDFTEGNGNVNLGGSISGHTTGITDQSFELAATPAGFYFESSTEITADAWHHVLISYDISAGVATHQVDYPNAFPVNTATQTTASATMYFAIDDANIKMIDANGSVIGGGDNDIITDEAQTIAQQSHTTRTYKNLFTSTATYTLSSPNVGAGAVGSPAQSVYTANVLKVQMAELQIFAGVTLNTSIEANRRAFITSDSKPAAMALAETLLGQAPDIKLHGSNNWISGANTGSLPTTFTPTGTISSYSPGPNG